MTRRGGGRPALATLAALAAALTAAGCVSLPSGGPVRSYSVTQGGNAQSQQYVQMVPQPPGKNWKPAEIVQGFLAASASFGRQGDLVAREYLTPQAARSWSQIRPAIVYKEGPDVVPEPEPVPGVKGTVTVRINGTEQAYLQGNGSYSVPSASARSAEFTAGQQFTLVREPNGQWRISVPPPELLLTGTSFQNDYQLHKLYFFDPSEHYLVPDPVYVALTATAEDLMNGLVNDLITPPGDWLSSGATRTALPAGTKLAGVTLDGVTAVVDLTGTVTKASAPVLQNIADQLAWTLSSNLQTGAAGQQAVQSVALELNGKAWNPGNPVQPGSSRKKPASGATSLFYYVDSAGYLTRRDGIASKPTRIEPVGLNVSQLAVSPDGKYLALLVGHVLYTGLIGGPLTRQGAGYSSVSWDAGDDLWGADGSQLFMFRGTLGSRLPLHQRVLVDVRSDNGVPDQPGPFYLLKVAPDGVRVAIVMDTGDGPVLTIGAISGQQGPTPQIALSQVQLLPRGGSQTFSGLTWYGSDNVIALSQPGPVATDYTVSGGGATSVPVDSDMTAITASAKHPLIATLKSGQLKANVNTSGAWSNLWSGRAPAYPG